MQLQTIIMFQEYPRHHLWQIFHPEGAGFFVYKELKSIQFSSIFLLISVWLALNIFGLYFHGRMSTGNFSFLRILLSMSNQIKSGYFSKFVTYM